MPTVFRLKSYRFFFFSREEDRMHIHVSSANGEAKIWLEPLICLAESYGFSSEEKTEILSAVVDKKEEIIDA